MRSWLVLVVVLGGCHLRAGLDAASRVNGPLQGVMSRSSVSRTDGVINLPPDNGRNYALEAGFGNSTVTISGLMAVHDVTSPPFPPGAGPTAPTGAATVRWMFSRGRGLPPRAAPGDSPFQRNIIQRT